MSSPKANQMLKMMFITFCMIAMIIGVAEFCIPMNHPFIAKSDMAAGTAQIRAKKYRATSSSPFMMRIAARPMGIWSINRRAAIARAIRTLLTSVFAHSSKWRAPKAWAVSPLVPMRRNEQFQYMKLKMVVPMARAPIMAAELPRRPAMAMSAMPSSGTVMLETMFGIVRRHISRVRLIRELIGERLFSNGKDSCSRGAEQIPEKIPAGSETGQGRRTAERFKIESMGNGKTDRLLEQKCRIFVGKKIFI